MAASFAVLNTQVLPAVAAETAPTSMEHAARVLNGVGTPERLYGFLKISASEKDLEFINRMQRESKGRMLPVARSKGNLMWIQGLEKPLKAIDPAKGLFVYDGRVATLNWKRGFQFNAKAFERVLHPRRMALVDWMLPEAHGAVNWDTITMTASGAALGAGTVMSIAPSSPEQQQWGPVLMMLGVFGLLAGYQNHQNKMNAMAVPAQNVTCMVDAYGMRRILVSGAGGSQLLAVTGTPGAPYQVSPDPGYPLQFSQLAANQLAGVCNNATMLNGVNSALTLPYAYPMPPSSPFMNFYSGYGVAPAYAVVPMDKGQIKALPPSNSVRAPASAAVTTPWRGAELQSVPTEDVVTHR